MKNIIMTAAAMVISVAALAQEFKLAKSTGKLMIREVNNVQIEGYAGNEIVFTARGGSRADDDRAKGLRAISSMGLEDNSGIGLSVVDKGDEVEVQQLKKMDGPDITIKVPKGVKVYYSHTSPHGSELVIKNVESDLDISTVHNSVKLSNVTGPIEVKTVHGDIDASLPANVKGPVVITSTHGHVDVSLPLTIKANIRMGTTWGEILVDPDFKIEIDRTGNMVKYNDKVNGKINGGGIDIELGSTHNNVYLRKK